MVIMATVCLCLNTLYKQVNRFIGYKICALLWMPSFFVSICVIVVLELTKWRPLGFSYNADCINRFLLTLSYSVAGANMFYFFNDYLPSLSKRYVTKKYVERKIREIKEQLRLLVKEDLHPFAFKQNSIDKTAYVAEFEGTDFSERYPLDRNLSKEDLINKRKSIISKLSNELLSSYLNVLTIKQLDFLDKILKSAFIALILRPALWTENKEPIGNDNQKEIGESIYKLYEYSCSF